MSLIMKLKNWVILSVTLATPTMARAECFSWVPQVHLEHGEGELWRITLLDNENFRLRRSLAFYYHGIPFSIDATVSDINLKAHTENEGLKYIGDIKVGSRVLPIELTLKGPTDGQIKIGGGITEIEKSVRGCDYMFDDAP